MLRFCEQEDSMNSIITETELKDAVRANTFIKNGIEQSCEGIKYDFRSHLIIKLGYL